jgi:hypothetical protein
LRRHDGRDLERVDKGWGRGVGLLLRIRNNIIPLCLLSRLGLPRRQGAARNDKICGAGAILPGKWRIAPYDYLRW